ncbi:MAG: hypothetical protein AAFO75_05445, partial [Pseudomonadota bacterium]
LSSKLLLILYTGVAVVLAVILGQLRIEGADLPIWTFALISGGVVPFLLVRGPPARVSPHRRRLAIAVGGLGLFLTFVFALATTTLSAEFIPLFKTVSNAPDWKLQDLTDLQAACTHLGNDACHAARALSRQVANFGGLTLEAIGPVIGLGLAIPFLLAARGLDSISSGIHKTDA